MAIIPGLKGRAETVVTAQNTAIAAGSGTLPVFATPFMVALMEQSAVSALAPCLEPGQSSVGTYLDVSHDSATPVGVPVWAECELLEVSGRFLTFSVSAYDAVGRIGAGTHKRCIIDVARFMANTEKKREG